MKHDTGIIGIYPVNFMVKLHLEENWYSQTSVSTSSSELKSKVNIE